MSDFFQVDPETGNVTSSTAAPGAPADRGGALADVAQQHIAPTSETTKASAERMAQGAFAKQQMRAIQLTLTMRGDATVVAKTVRRIEGLGPKLSGLYYVTSVKHSLSGSGGYTMTVKVRSNGVSAPVGGRGIPATTAKTEAKTNQANDSKNPAGNISGDTVGGGEELPVVMVDPETGTARPVQTWGRDPTDFSGTP